MLNFLTSIISKRFITFKNVIELLTEQIMTYHQQKKLLKCEKQKFINQNLRLGG